MALNIPMPQNGMDAFIKGFGLTDNLMQQLLQRRHLKQQQDQSREHQKQLENHFQQQMALRQQEFARGGANSDLQRRMMEEQLLGLKYKNEHFPALHETPEQKNASAVNKAISINEAKSNQKKLDEIEKTAQALFPYIEHVNTIEDILKRKPDLVGRTTQLADLFGMTKDEDVGTFLSSAQALQAHLAKELSNRGGYGVSRLVEQAKPNLGKSNAYNTGVIKDLKQSMRNSFDQMKSEYERLSNGKKFPYDFEQYFQEKTGMSSDGSKPKESGKRLKFNPSTGRLE